MKRFSILGLLILALIGFNGCSTDDDVVFVVNNEGPLTFTNDFLSEYVITAQTSGNLGERFTWNSVDVGEPTNISYELYSSLTGDFEADGTLFKTTAGNEIPVTIGELLAFATQLGMSNEVEGEDNYGTIHFRLRSAVGIPDQSEEDSFSPPVSMNLYWPPATNEAPAVCDLEEWYLVGAGVKFAGWSWDTPQVAACSGTNVYTANVDFLNNVDSDGNFRFFETATDWSSGRNYPYFIDEGYTIDERFEQADDDDSNFLFVGESGKYFLTIDALNKTITLEDPTPQGTCDLDQYWAVGAGLPDAGWSWDTPVQIMCEGNGVYEGWVNYTNEGDANFRFFETATDWSSGKNYPYFIDEGYTIDELLQQADDDDSNFQFIGDSGQYYTIIDTVNKTITLD